MAFTSPYETAAGIGILTSSPELERGGNNGLVSSFFILFSLLPLLLLSLLYHPLTPYAKCQRHANHTESGINVLGASPVAEGMGLYFQTMETELEDEQHKRKKKENFKFRTHIWVRGKEVLVDWKERKKPESGNLS